MKVRGADTVRAANLAVDRFASALAPAATRVELLKLKQAEASEMATRLAGSLGRLQKSQGASSAEIEQLRLAQIRATQDAKQYGAEIQRLESAQNAATRSAGGGSSNGGGLLGAFRGVGAALGIVAVGAAAARRALGSAQELVSDVVAAGSEINTVSSRMGVSAQALQEWRFIAERSDASAESITGAFNRLARGAASHAPVFRQLGVSVRDSSGHFRSQEDIFTDTIIALGGVGDQTRRAALAQQAFGRAGTELLPIVAQGAAGVQALRARFAELGGGLSDDVVQGAAAADDALDDFSLVLTGLRGVLVANILPVVTRTIEAIATWTGRFVEIARTSSIVQTALAGLTIAAGALAIAMFPVVAPVLLILGAMGLLFLAVEDVVTAFRGGESAFGGFIEQVFEAMGLTTTFSGLIDQLGGSWGRAVATMLSGAADLTEALEGVQIALGLGDLDAAAARTGAARTRAVDADRAVQDEQFRIDGREAQRIAARQALVAPAATVETASGRGERQRLGAVGAKSIQSSATYHIHGATDPDAVARVVDGHERRRLREAHDALYQPEPEPG